MYLNGDSVMGKQKSNELIEVFIEEFNRSVYHPILNRDIGQPKLNKHTVLFLLLPQLNGEEWPSSTHTAAIAVGAVYTAFDAHDAVDVYDVTTTNEQLRVLSGDYLSGIYYKLLAAIPNFEFIQVLSKTIGQINEMKTEFYTNMDMTASEQIEAIRSIQSECVVQFLQTFGYEKYVPIVQAALPLIGLLEDEKISGLGGWSLKSEHLTETFKQLRIEIDKALMEADFLLPHLVEDIREITMPLLGKPI